MTPHLTVREHDTLVRGERRPADPPNVTALAPEAFDAVQSLVLGELTPVASTTRLGGREALKLTQWVGVIRTPDGTTIEVLPKTHERPGSRFHDPDSLGRSRALLIRMLLATDPRFRVAPPADLDPARMPLFEFLLWAVLDGIRTAVRRGVPHAYVGLQEERTALRGRLDLPRQVRQPPHRAHLLHVQYDEFLPDRPETRLVRSTVDRVLRLTRLDGTRRLARELSVALGEVPPSRAIDRDFAAWRLERGHAHFAPLEGLCRLVLYQLNPIVGGVANRAQAVLFDMNRLYEAYVAHVLRLQHPDWRVDTQVTGTALGVVDGVRVFDLRPDLRITLPDGQVIIADTKWKRLNPAAAPAYDVSNADAYQMFTYSHVFQKAPQTAPAPLWLIYPHLPGLPARFPQIWLSQDRVLEIIAIDLHTAQPTVKHHLE